MSTESETDEAFLDRIKRRIEINIASAEDGTGDIPMSISEAYYLLHLATRGAESRNDVLEEAAKVADEIALDGWDGKFRPPTTKSIAESTGNRIAAAIRAMKEKQ